MAINRILEILASLISMGGGVLATRYERTGNVVGPDRVEDALFRQWRTSSLAFLNTLPFEYVYRSEFETHCQFSVYDEAVEGMAILQAARDDIEGGYFQKVENLVSASVFSDFLEMAEYLLNNGYKDPTASLVGAVLEDGLRHICMNYDISIKSREDISSLNSKLAAKGVYNPLQQKQIQVWNDIRNNADHGNFKEYKEDDVRDMLGGVRKFLASYLV
jgi:hypothetical protein